MGPRTVYDALTMPVVDPAMVAVALSGAAVFTAVAAASWFQLRRRRRRRSEDSSKELMARGVATIMAAAVIGFLVYAGFQTVLWRYDYEHHRYVILDGCVAQFSERVQSDHDLGVDDFTLQGRAFRLSDSGWRMGYHRSHHRGSPIEEGVHLRAFAQGPQLLRIEAIPTRCPA
jgi:hypothetical protein